MKISRNMGLHRSSMKNIFFIFGCVLLTQSSFSQSVEPTKTVEPTEKRSNKITGFKLNEIEAGSIYEQLGLKKGDVIKSYNGKPVHSTQDSMEIYTQLKTSKKVNFEIVRDGKVQKIQYNIK